MKKFSKKIKKSFIFDKQSVDHYKGFNIVKEYTDSEIIECLRNRQSYVVHYLSERYMPMIRHMVIQLGGSTEDARDIFQDGLIIMLEKIDSGELILSCKFKTFLYCVCENLWKTVLTRRKAQNNYLNRREEFDDNKDFTELIDNKLYEDIFRNVIENLDTVSKTILKLYWQDASLQEIADKMGLTYNYVRKMKYEAQIKIARGVKEHPEYMRIVKTDYAAREVVH